jgi:adenylate kinase family enzyme
VVGNSGSGKTTLAAVLASGMAAPHLELDSVFHQPGWEPLAAEEFRARVGQFAAGERWVADGNYSTVQDLLWQRADTVVWLDLPRHRVMRQLIWRTLRRLVARAELWNGNRESWANLLRADPAQSIIAWGWTQHHSSRERYARAAADPANGHLTFVRLQTPGQVTELIWQAREQAAARQVPLQQPGEVAGDASSRATGE